MQIILNEKFERAVLKDELAFKDIYRQYFIKLYRFAYSLVQCKEPAEEIVHDVLVNLWKKRNDFAEIENLNTYLYVSVKNLSLNYLRDEARHIHIDIDSVYDHQDNNISIDPESICIAKERAADLNASINSLPVKCRLIFNLVKIDGLKYKEVAVLLNISPKTVENQLAIAVKKIAIAIHSLK
jgi:RNA polymerase sigma-70 factor (ECF subfamily)